MKLEDEIKQQNFRSDYQKAAINLIYTHNWLVDQLKTIFKGYDVTVQQFNVLRILRGQYPKPVTTSVIRSRMLDKMSDASRIVDRLHKKELVKRSTCPHDKRLVDVVISEEGLKLLNIMDAEEIRLDNILGSLDETEIMTLNQLLDKMRN